MKAAQAIPTPEVAILVVAAGRGHRVGGETPKQYLRLAGEPVLTRTLRALAEAAPSAALLTVIHPDDSDLYNHAAALLPDDARARLLPPAHGGATRQQSVRAGLELLSQAQPKVVLIHDAARPFSTSALIRKAIEAAREFAAAAPGDIPLDRTLLRRALDKGGRG